jgi:two-component system phosphate regulon sensor histidine kinase PhoR
MSRRERKGHPAQGGVATPEAARGDVAREIDRLRKELAEMQRISRLKDQVLSVAAHELATPLTSIKAYVETLVENWGSPQFVEGEEFLQVLKRETGRLLRIVERTLQISRLASGTQIIERRPVELNELVQEIVESLRPVLRERQVLLEVHLPRSLPRVSADRDLLEQVFINLLDNAAKFSHRGRVVTLRISSRSGIVEIEVRDQGFGIARDELQHIFDPYFRSRDDRVGHERGTGLGLAIVKTVVEQHGGQITVESEIDRGTTFRFSLPQV